MRPAVSPPPPSAAPTTAPEPFAHAATVLRMIAVEAAEARILCDRLHALVSTLMDRASERDRHEALEEAQVLDVLIQHVAVLADFAADAADRASPEGLVAIDSALAAVPLAAMARRMARALSPDAAAAEPVDGSGELHLF